MKELILTNGEKVQLDDQDYDYYNQWSWFRSHTGLVYRHTRQGHIALHKLICPVSESMEVDHKDRNQLNCQRSNLRPATHSQNGANKIAPPNTSGYRGVYWNRAKGRFHAQIKKNKQTIYLGLYQSPEEAARAYDKAAKKYFGDFAILNFPEETIQ